LSTYFQLEASFFHWNPIQSLTSISILPAKLLVIRIGKKPADSMVYWWWPGLAWCWLWPEPLLVTPVYGWLSAPHSPPKRGAAQSWTIMESDLLIGMGTLSY
jgi:hypothetical protein